MNYEHEREIISLLKEHNDLQRHRNAQLTALYNKLADIETELCKIRGNL